MANLSKVWFWSQYWVKLKTILAFQSPASDGTAMTLVTPLIDWVKVLHPTWHKLGHFGDVGNTIENANIFNQLISQFYWR